MKFDLHVHSKYSIKCGFLEPKDIVKAARACKLDGIAVVDHDTIKGGKAAKDFETEDLKIIVGSEIKTNLGEVIGLFLTHEIKSTDFIDVLEDIRDQGGISVLPHPFDKMRSNSFMANKESAADVDAVEVFNSRCIFNKYNSEAMQFACEHGLVKVGGSDAHFSNEIGNAGIITESGDIREAILKNDIRVFGVRSSIVNHINTKVLKLWRKTRSG